MMKLRQLPALALAAAVALSAGTCGARAADQVTHILLSDTQVTVDGKTASTGDSSAVHTGADIIYYAAGTDATYGEGAESEKHSAAEAEAHTVVTITQPGTYRLTGSLSAGQIAIDLGEDAKTDPEAVVTLILDGVEVTCTVAPALIFYNVYECDAQWVAYDADESAGYTPSATVDTSAAGANVVIAAGSQNTFIGSHVARIYKEGTTKKLHKYDGAFYSRMSMNIDGEDGDNSGTLSIAADNEGLDSELHLTINGGTIGIIAQDDGINTNEDGVSVTTVNGGTLTVDAGNGGEGDGVDSNGYLVINGGNVWTMANETSPDGGIDADMPILINGGTLSAFGTRNDAASSASEQPYMELSFASTLPAGSVVKVTGADGNTVWIGTTGKKCQSITLSTADLALDTLYHVYVDDVLQCWSGNSSGRMGGPGGGQRPGGMEGQTSPELSAEGRDLGGRGDRERPEGSDPGQMGQPPEGGMGGGFGGQTQADGTGSTDFTLTAESKTFSGVCDSDASGKTRVSFTVDGVTRSGPSSAIAAITAVTADLELDPSLVQITVTDDPSEDYSATCLLSDGLDAVNALLPEAEGDYLLTVAVVSGTGAYTGATQISFSAGALPFADLGETDQGYEAVMTLYKAGIMTGTGADTFTPDGSVTRAQAVTVLARLAGAESGESAGFSDVTAGSWYAGWVSWAVANGIVEGDGGGRFLPDQTVTAQQMELMLSRYAGEGYAASTSFTGELTRSQLAQMLLDIF